MNNYILTHLENGEPLGHSMMDMMSGNWLGPGNPFVIFSWIVGLLVIIILILLIMYLIKYLFDKENKK